MKRPIFLGVFGSLSVDKKIHNLFDAFHTFNGKELAYGKHVSEKKFKSTNFEPAFSMQTKMAVKMLTK